MRIIHLAVEIAPLAKIGGLADAVFGLAAFQAKTDQVEVIIPKYEFIPSKYLKEAKLETRSLRCYERGIIQDNSVWSLNLSGISLKMIEPYNREKYFQRPNVYGYEDDNARFLYFVRAALQMLSDDKGEIDILHVHDWHTAIAFLMLEELFPELQKKIKSTVLTIHNLAFQGKCASHNFNDIGLNAEKLLLDERLKDDYSEMTFNILKGAIYLADAVTTVSPTYAREIETKEEGCGLEAHLAKNRFKLRGIINGIDYGMWNPQTDPCSFARYSAEMPASEIISAKEQNKNLLRQKLHLPSSSQPIISCVSRLSYQKGHTLIKHAILKALKMQCQFVLLGSFSCQKIEKEFLTLKKRLAKTSNASFNFGYDEELSRQIYAGSDFLIVPSIYEPCGLTQLIAMRYGTIPIVRKTGGLADTVFEKMGGNGYLFEHANVKEMGLAIKRAVDGWRHEETRKSLIRDGMSEDHSWKTPGQEYLKLYSEFIVIPKRPA